VVDEKRVKERLALVPSGEENRYYTYIGATKDPLQLKKAVELAQSNERVCGIKMFAGKSTGNLEIINEEDQKLVYKTLANAGYTGVIAVHCEKEACMKNLFDPENPITHGLSRPNEAEIESIKDQIRFALEAGYKGMLHVCHISCKESIQIVEQAKSGGKIKITCGATPHHLLWSTSPTKKHGRCSCSAGSTKKRNY
jgi:dihydroorotase